MNLLINPDTGHERTVEIVEACEIRTVETVIGDDSLEQIEERCFVVKPAEDEEPPAMFSVVMIECETQRFWFRGYELEVNHGLWVFSQT